MFSIIPPVTLFMMQVDFNEACELLDRLLAEVGLAADTSTSDPSPPLSLRRFPRPRRPLHPGPPLPPSLPRFPSQTLGYLPIPEPITPGPRQ